MNDIFTSQIALDVFCMDIAEEWIKHQQRRNRPVSSEEFMDWVMDDLIGCLEMGFDDVYEEEFGHREDEEE